MSAQYKRWIVGLDFTNMDAPLIRYTATLARLLEPTDVYFVHVEADFEKPEFFPEELNASLPTIDENQKAAMKTEVQAYFQYEKSNVHVEVIEGKPFETLIHWSSVKKIDLLIAGRKPFSDGILPHRLSRKLPCSVLFVPSMVSNLNKVLVPIDFSKHSILAVQSALALKTVHPNLEVVGLHIFEVPSGYSKSGKTFEEFAEIMRSNAVKGFERFKERADVAIDCIFRLKEQSTADLILDEAEKAGANMIVMGSKGQSDSAVLFLGSLTERLLTKNINVPIWVVKVKGENIGLLKAMELI